MIGAALGKELRALAPTFAGAAVSLCLVALLPEALRVPAAVLVLCGGVTTLGSLAVGHEYTCRTLSPMLARPLRRGTALAAKAAILLPMVLAVTALAILVLQSGGRDLARAGPGGEGRALLVLLPLAAVCLAPFLSMACRSALAAIVFTIAIGGMVMATGEVTGLALYGFRNPASVRAFTLAFTWQAMLALCAAGAAGTWWLFMRLQALDGHPDVELPAWLRTSTGVERRVRSPLATLLVKELRLQHMSFIVGALYVLGAVAVWALQRLAPELPRVPVEAISAIYMVLLVLLIGSIAGAEERQLGTLPAQLLLPSPAWQQWTVKAAAATGLALLLAIALPAAVTFIMASPDEPRAFAVRLLREPVVGVVLLTSFSLYVATLSSSGVRAMVHAIPLLLAAAAIVAFWAMMVQRLGLSFFMQDQFVRRSLLVYAAMWDSVRFWSQLVHLATVVVASVLLLRFGYTNYRVAELRTRRVAAQALILVTVTLGGLSVPALLWWSVRPAP